jgi:hypothetical protein
MINIDETQSENQLNKDVFLLAILKRKEDETLKDVILTMEETGTFNQKKGKKYLKELKAEKYIENDSLTFLGIEKAKQVEMMFKI